MAPVHAQVDSCPPLIPNYMYSLCVWDYFSAAPVCRRICSAQNVRLWRAHLSNVLLIEGLGRTSLEAPRTFFCLLSCISFAET